MLSRPSGRVDDLFDDELRRLEATVFVHVEPVGQLHDAPVGRSGLVEGDRVNAVTAGSRAYA